MREILFRAWDKTEKKYRKFDGMHDTMVISTDGKIDYYNLQNGSGYDEYILEQFTGLLDKNGKRIFEGDVCKLTYRDCGLVSSRLFNVEYIYGGFSPFNGGGNDDVFNDWVEVVGNIHDNPELLEVK
jgi:uncharacterized phage protein (TIGR01671 family)